jgi:diguanylate cyclase (GGDEF)-like protein/PAS domain S-box-containing protein
VARAAAAAGAETIAVQTQHTEGRDPSQFRRTYLKRVGWDRIDAFVVTVDSFPVEGLRALRSAGKPVVVISHTEPGFACPVVVADNRSGAAEAMRHLLAHGHSRIAFAGDLRSDDVAERFEAYQQVLREHGLTPDPALFFPAADNLVPAGYECGRQMIAAGLPSTAVFAGCDTNALGIIEALTEAGYSLPHDQAVIGFDDIPAANTPAVPLSTVSQNFMDLGTEAVRLVALQLAGQEVPPGEYRVKTSFVPRESCGCSGSLAGVASQPPAEDPAGAFVAEIVRVASAPAPELCGPDPSRADQDAEAATASAARDMASIFRAGTERELTSLELLRLKQLSAFLCRYDEGRQPFPLLALCDSLARQLQVGDGAPPAQLGQCLQQVGMGLSRATAMGLVEVNKKLHQLISSDYAISMHLLQSQGRNPRSLDWMAQTVVRVGALVLWAESTPTAVLDVAGTYDASNPQGFAFPEPSYLAPDFPPPELLARAKAEPDSVLLMLPMTTESKDWGYLCLLTATVTTLANHSTYFEWAALLGQALDVDALATSLRHRNEDLALSYQRERDMAAAAKQSEERYALAARAANDGLWDWDLTEGTIYYAPRWKQMLGYGDDAVGTHPDEWLDRVHPDDKVDLLETMAEAVGAEPGPFENEHRIRASDGTYRWVLCRGLVVPGAGTTAARLVGSLTDITERRSLQEQLVHQALYDNLTGLPNRALFLDRLSQCIAARRRNPELHYAVLWLDLDGFKEVNDTLGHPVGDELLVRVANRLAGELREADTAARFGGDEFAVLLQSITDVEAASRVAARVHDQLSKPYDLNGHQVVVTASIGITASNLGYDRPEDVLRDADVAMYRAKASGPNTSAVFDPSMATHQVRPPHAALGPEAGPLLGQLELC